MNKFVKDPDAVLDYTWDWADFLEPGETIVDHTVFVYPTVGVEVDESSADADSVTAWLSGGSDYTRVFVGCRIETSQGRTDDRSIYLLVRER